MDKSSKSYEKWRKIQIRDVKTPILKPLISVFVNFRSFMEDRGRIEPAWGEYGEMHTPRSIIACSCTDKLKTKPFINIYFELQILNLYN